MSLHKELHTFRKSDFKKSYNWYAKVKFSKEQDLFNMSKKKSNFKVKIFLSTQKLLELIHMNLFGSSGTKTFVGNFYALVLADDFSRFTRTSFLASNSKAFKAFKMFANIIESEKD